MPSLCKIEFLGSADNEIYRGIPIDRLINEHMGGQKPLQALRVVSNMHPALTSTHMADMSSAPIQLTHLDLNTSDGRDGGVALRLLPLLASSLVELRLSSVAANQMWEPFLPSIAAAAVNSRANSLVFSSLKSLSLRFTKMCEIKSRSSSGIQYSIDDEDDDWYDEEEDYDRLSPGGVDPDTPSGTPGHMISTRFGVPQFPVLNKLEIRRIPRNVAQFLSLFADCPITTLSIWLLHHRITEKFDFSSFSMLRSLSIRSVNALKELDFDESVLNRSLTQIYTTANPKLQSLTLMLHTYCPYVPCLESPTFASNLAMLTLEGHLFIPVAAALLPQLDNLLRLNIFGGVATNTTGSKLAKACKSQAAPIRKRMLNKSLRCIRADQLQEPADDTDWGLVHNDPKNKVALAGLYRGMLLELEFWRFPNLDTLLADESIVDILKENIVSFVKANPDFKHLRKLRCLKIQASEERFINLCPIYY
ncbi:hypothetical protein GGI21_002854 [Coemansia aciculifera]|nr:hypothetical protein GGI21_002854 [Coemansia aciculifera]